MLIYKILLTSEWDELERVGRFDGSPLDRRDGFVHCSTREQVAETACRFFADEERIVVLAVDTLKLGDDLRWEPASGGELFPHVHAPLLRSAVAAEYHITGASSVDRALPARS